MWRLFAAIAALCIVLLPWPDALIALRWQRGALADGQPWRMLSAHFVHFGALHALANLTGMVLVIEWLGAPVRPVEAAWVMLCSAIAITGGLALFSPAVSWYVGLSGVVHGLWAGFALLGWSRQRPESRLQRIRLPAAALGLLALKLAMPPLPWLASSSGLPVVPQSHWYGALGGSVAALALMAHAARAALPLKSGLE